MQYYGTLPVLDTLFGFSRAILRQAPSLEHPIRIFACNTPASSQSWTLCLDSCVQYSGKLPVLDTQFGFSDAMLRQAPSFGHSVWILGCNTTASTQSWTLCLDSRMRYYGKLPVLDTLFRFSRAILRQTPSLGHSVWILACNIPAFPQSWTLCLDSRVQCYDKLSVLDTLFGFSRAKLRQALSLRHSVWILTCKTNRSSLRQALSLGHAVWILICNTTASSQSWTLCLDSHVQYYGKLPVLDTLFGFSDAILRQTPSLGHSAWILTCNTTASSQSWTLCLDSRMQYSGKLPVLDTLLGFSRAILQQAPSLGHSVWILGCNTPASYQSWTLCLDSHVQYYSKLPVLDTLFGFSDAILRQATSLGHSVLIFACNTPASSQSWTLCLDSHVQYSGKLPVLDTLFWFSRAILRQAPSLRHSVLDSHVQYSGKLPVLDTLFWFSRAILRQAPSLRHSVLDSHVQYYGKLPVLDTLFWFSRAILRQAPSLRHSVLILTCNTPASSQSWTLCFDSRVQYSGKLPVLDTLFGFWPPLLRQAPSLGHFVWNLTSSSPASSQSMREHRLLLVAQSIAYFVVTQPVQFPKKKNTD